MLPRRLSVPWLELIIFSFGFAGTDRRYDRIERECIHSLVTLKRRKLTREASIYHAPNMSPLMKGHGLGLLKIQAYRYISKRTGIVPPHKPATQGFDLQLNDGYVS